MELSSPTKVIEKKPNWDLINLLVSLLHYIGEKKLSAAEIYNLSKHLQEQPEVTLRFLGLQNQVARLTVAIEDLTHEVKETQNIAESILISANKLLDTKK